MRWMVERFRRPIIVSSRTLEQIIGMGKSLPNTRSDSRTVWKEKFAPEIFQWFLAETAAFWSEMPWLRNGLGATACCFWMGTTIFLLRSESRCGVLRDKILLW